MKALQKTKNKNVGKSDIQQFLEFVNQGIDAWVNAGKLLIEMVDQDKGAFAKIISQCPHLSVDTLITFERIGRKQVSPFLLMDKSPGAERLLALPYECQEKYANEKIPVVIAIRRGAPIIMERSIKELSKEEAFRVIAPTHIRTPEEQEKLMPRGPMHRNESDNGGGRHNETTQFSTCGFYRIKLDSKGMPSMEKCPAPITGDFYLTVEIVGESRYVAGSAPFSVALHSAPFEVVMPKAFKEDTVDDSDTPKKKTLSDTFSEQIESCQKQIDEKEEAIASLDPKSPVVKSLVKDIQGLRDKIVKYELLSQ